MARSRFHIDWAGFLTFILSNDHKSINVYTTFFDAFLDDENGEESLIIFSFNEIILIY